MNCSIVSNKFGKPDWGCRVMWFVSKSDWLSILTIGPEYHNQDSNTK